MSVGDPSIDLIVVNYKTYGLIQNFIDSYHEFKPKVKSNLFIMDNEANEAEYNKLDLGEAKLFPIRYNLGYAGACNLGAAFGTSDYMAFLNSDTRFNNPDCVDSCVDHLLTHPDVAVVGPLQYASDGRVTHGGIFGVHDKPEHRMFGAKCDLSMLRDVRDAVTVSGSAYFTSRKIWDEMAACDIYRQEFPDAEGAWPPFPFYYEETLYSYHVYGHGYKCVYLGSAEMIHEWGKSTVPGSQQHNFEYGRKHFRRFCDAHNIPHD